MTLKRCTLAGVDEATPLFELAVISDLHSFAEWAFLYDPGKHGARGRYPTVERMQRAFRELPIYVNLALHVRDTGVAQLLDGEAVVTDLMRQIQSRGGRMQLDCDFAEDRCDLRALRALAQEHPAINFVIRHNERYAAVNASLTGVQNCSVLYDVTRARGFHAEAWPPAPSTVRCGYAGGLGPETLAKALPAIFQAAGHADFWIEMEDQLRDGNDRFDLSAARRCLEIAGAEMAERMQMPRQHPRRRQVELDSLVGLTRDAGTRSEFEVMLEQFVEATRDVLDPRVLDLRRKAEQLLATQGAASRVRGAEPAPPSGRTSPR
jgi:hypothetical protein